MKLAKTPAQPVGTATEADSKAIPANDDRKPAAKRTRAAATPRATTRAAVSDGPDEPKPTPRRTSATPATPAKKTAPKRARTATRSDVPPVPVREEGRDGRPGPDELEELVSAETPETGHIDRTLVDVARASAALVEVVPSDATELELVRPPSPAEKHRRASAPLWAKVAADPGFAAEHAAREAVLQLGPQAQRWVDRMRTRYPQADPDGLARLATDEAIRAARRKGAASGAGGVLGSAAATGLLAYGQARLALTIAAAYSFDPTSRDRAHDLLVLLRVPRLTQPAPAALRNAGRWAAEVAVRRVAAHLMPFGAAIAAATIGARATRDVSLRATAYYRLSHHKHL